jgi:hypothetical protein
MFITVYLLPSQMKLISDMAVPMSIAAPKSLPNCILETGKLAAVSRYLTHSYHPYSAMLEMSAVSPFTLLSGTWPSNPNMSIAVLERTYAYLIRQSSHSRLVQTERIIYLPMMGVTLSGPTFVYGDNMSVVHNTQRPESVLKKKSNSLCYHMVRESSVIGESIIGHVPYVNNPADISTKVVADGKKRNHLIRLLLHDLCD